LAEERRIWGDGDISPDFSFCSSSYPLPTLHPFVPNLPCPGRYSFSFATVSSSSRAVVSLQVWRTFFNTACWGSSRPPTAPRVLRRKGSIEQMLHSVDMRCESKTGSRKAVGNFYMLAQVEVEVYVELDQPIQERLAHSFHSRTRSSSSSSSHG